MLEIPEYVYLETPSFVEADGQSVIDLIHRGLSEEYLHYSLDNILLDSRVAELAGWSDSCGLSFRQAVNLRIKQVGTTLAEFPDEDNTRLEAYLDFLQGI